MARRASAGAPARLALLLVAALVACVACAAKSCKFDDNCHLNKAGQAKRGICQDLGDGETVGATDMCSGCQCVNKQGNNLNKKGNPVKKCKRCQQVTAITPVVDTPPPPPTNASPPPPPVDPVDPTGCFIPGCTIVTQWGNS